MAILLFLPVRLVRARMFGTLVVMQWANERYTHDGEWGVEWVAQWLEGMWVVVLFLFRSQSYAKNTVEAEEGEHHFHTKKFFLLTFAIV